jgi:RNA polymerase sigma-70 factor (family 1)
MAIINALDNEMHGLNDPAPGEEQAFTRIYTRYYKRVYRHALWLTQSPSLSQDIAQEIFVKIWLYREKIADVECLSSWLHTLTRNYTLDLIRRQQAEDRWRSNAGQACTDTHFSTEDRLRHRELLRIWQQAIDALPHRQRQVYRLSRQQGAKNKEIAGQLRLSPCTVKAHLAQAHRSICRYMHAVS